MYHMIHRQILSDNYFGCSNFMHLNLTLNCQGAESSVNSFCKELTIDLVIAKLVLILGNQIAQIWEISLYKIN